MPSSDNWKYYANTGYPNGGSATTEVCDELLRAIHNDSFDDFKRGVSTRRYHSLSYFLRGITQDFRRGLLRPDEVALTLGCHELMDWMSRQFYKGLVDKDPPIKKEQFLMDLLWYRVLGEADLKDIDNVYQWLGFTVPRQRFAIFERFSQERRARLSALNHTNSSSSR